MKPHEDQHVVVLHRLERDRGIDDVDRAVRRAGPVTLGGVAVVGEAGEEDVQVKEVHLLVLRPGCRPVSAEPRSLARQAGPLPVVALAADDRDAAHHLAGARALLDKPEKSVEELAVFRSPRRPLRLAAEDVRPAVVVVDECLVHVGCLPPREIDLLRLRRAVAPVSRGRRDGWAVARGVAAAPSAEAARHPARLGHAKLHVVQAEERLRQHGVHACLVVETVVDEPVLVGCEELARRQLDVPDELPKELDVCLRLAQPRGPLAHNAIVVDRGELVQPRGLEQLPARSLAGGDGFPQARCGLLVCLGPPVPEVEEDHVERNSALSELRYLHQQPRQVHRWRVKPRLREPQHDRASAKPEEPLLLVGVVGMVVLREDEVATQRARRHALASRPPRARCPRPALLRCQPHVVEEKHQVLVRPLRVDHDVNDGPEVEGAILQGRHPVHRRDQRHGERLLRHPRREPAAVPPTGALRVVDAEVHPCRRSPVAQRAILVVGIVAIEPQRAEARPVRGRAVSPPQIHPQARGLRCRGAEDHAQRAFPVGGVLRRVLDGSAGSQRPDAGQALR